MINTVTIVGRLTKTPETRYVSDTQMAVTRMTVANETGYGEKKKTNFIPVVVFGKQAENCEKYLDKGRMVAITGQISTGSYTNKEGQKVYTTDVIANEVQFIDFGNKTQENANQNGSDAIPEGFSAIDDSELPF